MFQTKEVPDIVNPLFERSLKEQVLVARLSIKFAAQTVGRNDCHPLILVPIAKDKLMRGFIKIEFRNCQHHSAIGRRTSRETRDQRVQKQLVPIAVEHGSRKAQHPFDREGMEEPLLQAQGQAQQERRIDRIDRNDIDLTHDKRLFCVYVTQDLVQRERLSGSCAKNAPAHGCATARPWSRDGSLPNRAGYINGSASSSMKNGLS